MFPAALFTIAKIWKQTRCPSTEEWVKKMGYIYIHTYIHIYTMEYYSAIYTMEYYSAIYIYGIYIYTHIYTHIYNGILLCHIYSVYIHIYTMEYYSAILFWKEWHITLPFFSKKNEILRSVATWTDAEGIMVSEINKKKKDKYHVISLVCVI